VSPTAIYGWLAHGIVFGALVSLLPLGGKRRYLGLAAIPLAFVTGIAALLHGYVSTPSVTLLALAVWQLAGRAPTPLGHRPAWILVGFAAIFYPLALGFGPFDPYAIGYQPWPLLLACVVLAAMLLRYRRNDWLLILGAALAGYASGLFANLWDALIDPLLILVALAVIVKRLAQRSSAGGKTTG
jgi:hypothetical protein